MADNYTATPGSGLTFGADEVTINSATVLVPRVKLVVGADGSATDVAPGQATMAASLPVAIASNQTAVPVNISTVTATLAVNATIVADSSGLALDDTLTDGSARTVVNGAAMGTTTAANITSTPEGSNHQAFDVQVYHDGAAVNPAEIRALTSSDVVSATPVASEIHMGEVGGLACAASASFTRPSDTTAYTIGDSLNAAVSEAAINAIAVGRISNGTGTITGAILTDSALQTTKGNFTVYLFDTIIAAPQDNAQFNPTSTEIKHCIGAIQFGSVPLVLASNCLYVVNDLSIKFKCASGTQNLYWVLVANNAYTPVSGEEFCLRLHVDQN